MTPTRKLIELREGVTAEVLVTPALYGVARRRGMELKPASESPADIVSSYARLLFCAAVNAWEVRQMDEPQEGEFRFRYADFDEWAWRDREGFAEAMSFAYTALTGKALKDAVAEEKKKERAEEIDLDYGPVEDFLVGELGMSQREAALVGMTEFAQRRKGWENARRERWEVARWMVWQEYLLSPFIRSGHKPGKPSDILPLAGDPVPEQRTAAECRIDEGTQRTLIEIFDELKKRNG